MDEKKLLDLCAESLNSAQQVWLAKQILARHPKTLIEPDATQEIAAASNVKQPQDQSIDEEAFTRIHVQPESESKIKSSDPKSESPQYKILGQLGRGGMGTVFAADQVSPIRRQVAIKVIRETYSGPTSVVRFEIERQAMALMNHPNIARIYDGGTLGADVAVSPGSIIGNENVQDGRPFLAMELIQGSKLLDYCDENNLTITERLELFRQICDGVQHAHQKGVIHRDLKPSNIVVTLRDGKPVPKIIDFGLAKGVDHRLTERTLFTDFGSLLGTLEYMSPEQASGNNLNIDSRTDIYSLGVILYELLTGARPFDSERLRKAAYDEAVRIIREEEPEKPSSKLSHSTDSIAKLSAHRKIPPQRLVSQMTGELDWVVMKALAKERDRRYATAKDFAEDITNYLEQKPIDAGPPDPIYRMKKFLWRNRTASSLAGLFLLSLVLATTGTTYGMLRAIDAEKVAAKDRDVAKEAKRVADDERGKAVSAQKLADEQRQIATAVNRFLVEDILQQSNLASVDIDPRMTFQSTLKDLLLRASSSIENLQARPAEKATVEQLLGESLTDLGIAEVARNHLLNAEKYWREQHSPDDLRRLACLQALARVDLIDRQYDQAIKRANEVVERRTKLLGATSKETLEARIVRARGYTGKKDFDRAKSELSEVIDRYPAQTSGQRQNLLSYRMSMADLFVERGDFASANSLYRQLLEDSDKMGTISRPVKLTILNNYGTSLLYETLSTRSLSIEEKLARFQQVEKIFRNSCEISEQLLGPDYPKHLITRFNLANICFIQGETRRLEARANPAKMAESLEIKLDNHRRCVANKLTSHNIYVENCYGLARHYDYISDKANFEKYTKAGLEAGSKFMPESSPTMIKLRNYEKRLKAR